LLTKLNLQVISNHLLITYGSMVSWPLV
jgi:hypothetical protein